MKETLSLVFKKYLKFFVSAFLFIIWMLFFDQRDFFYIREQKQKLQELEYRKHFYEQEIEKAKNDLSDLQNNPAALEKFAREHYMMKKDGEDIFIFEPTDSVKSPK